MYYWNRMLWLRLDILSSWKECSFARWEGRVWGFRCKEQAYTVVLKPKELYLYSTSTNFQDTDFHVSSLHQLAGEATEKHNGKSSHVLFVLRDSTQPNQDPSNTDAFITYPWQIWLRTAVQGMEGWEDIDAGKYFFPYFKVEVFYPLRLNTGIWVLAVIYIFQVFNTGKCG